MSHAPADITEGDEFGSRAVKPTEPTHAGPDPRSGSIGITEGDELDSREVKPTEPTHAGPDPRSGSIGITEGDELDSREVKQPRGETHGTNARRPRSAKRINRITEGDELGSRIINSQTASQTNKFYDSGVAGVAY